MFLYDVDNKVNAIKEKANEHKNKLDSENEEKARQAAERKAKDSELITSQLQMHKKANSAFESISDMSGTIKESLPQLVNFMASSPTPENTSFTSVSSAHDAVVQTRLSRLEDEMIALKAVAESNATTSKKSADEMGEIKNLLTLLVKRKNDPEK